MLSRIVCALSLMLAGASAALAFPAPYTCTRNFYVATSGADSATCGAVGSPCASIPGANNATSIGGTGTVLQAGDCVNVAAGTYNTGQIVLTRGGSFNAANGYVAYIGAANYGSKLNFTSGYAGLIAEANYLAIDGFEFAVNYATTDEVMHNSPHGVSYLPNNSHHLMYLNNLVHDSNGGGMGAIWNDYYLIAGNTIYNVGQCTPYGESGISVLWPTQIVGFSSSLPWDTQYYHIQILDNTVYNVGFNFGTCPVSITKQNEEADGIIPDNFQLQNYTQGLGDPPNPGPYPYHTLILGNVTYNNQGRGINVNNGQNIDVYNNTTYHNGTDTHSLIWCEILLGGSNVNIANNIAIAGTYAPENGVTLCWISSNGYSESGTAVFNNDFYNGTGSSGVVVSGTQNDGAHLASITAPSSHNLLAVNPLLVNPTTDFHPNAAAPVVGTGATIPTNILQGPIQTNDGNVFTSPPNIGAFNTVSGSVSSVAGPVSVVSGGPAASPFVADAGFNGGTTSGPYTGSIDTSALTAPIPPQGALQFQRYGTSFYYSINALTPNSPYVVTLYFVEFADSGAGQRKENVSINGTQVLSAFDIFATAGAKFKAVSKAFTVNASSTGTITINLSVVSGLSDPNAEITAFSVAAPPANSVQGPVSLVAGGGAVAPTWISDAGFNGGVVATGETTVDTSLLPSPVPAQAVLTNQRYGTSFYYLVSGLTPSTNYTVNLFFTESYWSAANQRTEQVQLNGVIVLNNFDIFATAGAAHKAVLKTFTQCTDSNGNIKIQFIGQGPTDNNAKINAIQVLTLASANPPPVAVNQSATTPFNTAVSVNLANGASNSPTSATLLSNPTNGTNSLSGLNAVYTPTTGFSGVDSYTFSLSNANGSSNIATATITVTGGPPPTAANQSVTTPFNTAVSVNLSSGSSGSPTSATLLTNPSHGSIVLNGFSCTYTPNAGYSGSDSYTFNLSNANGASNTATTTITVQPNPVQPPTAANQTVTTPFNTPVTINLSQGSTGGPTSASLLTSPAHGSNVLNGFNSTYTPNSGFSGNDSYTFNVSNTNGTSNTATANIVVQAQIQPPIASGQSITTAYQTSFQVDLTTGSSGGTPTSALITTAPTHGAVTISAFNARYTPNSGYSGSDSFQFSLSNSGGQSSPATISITVNAPVSGSICGH
jgi:large repetitive protein